MSEAVAELSQKWCPDADVRNHSGDPVDQQANFFAPPPAEIGEVFTAHSTWRKGQPPPGKTIRNNPVVQVVGGGIGGIAALVGMGALVASKFVYSSGGDWGSYIVVGLAGLFLALLCFAFISPTPYVCSYVGSQGACKITANKDRRATVATEILRFEDAAELRTQGTRVYRNRSYEGSNYAYVWTDEAGKPLFTLKSSFQAKKGLPKANDAYHFALSAERAWTLFLFDHAIRELETTGGLRFKLAGQDFVRVATGSVEISVKGNHVQVPASDVESFTMSDGVLHLAYRDARFGGKNKIGFPYYDLANGRLFLMAMEKLAGLSPA